MYRVGDKVTGKVQYFDGNYYIVKIDEDQNGFVYYNNIDLEFTVNPDDQIGKEYEFEVKEIFPLNKQNKIEITRIPIMLEELEQHLHKVEVGNIIQIKEFIKNKGGIEFKYEEFKIFIPYKLMSHSYISEDEDISFLIGKQAKIIECEKVKFGYDVVASIKILEEDPMDVFIKDHNVGDVLKAEILRKEHYGIFLKLDKDVKGLLHKNDYSDELIIDIDSFQDGEEIDVKIKLIDEEKKLIDVTANI